jgi:hypothetical protein
MRVQLAPADEHGCGHYRMIYPARALDGRVQASFVKGWDTIKSRTTGQIIGLPPLEVDVVVLQRPLHENLGELIPLIQAQGIAVVVDVDDDFTCLDSRHPAFVPTHPRYSPHSNWRHLQRACAAADLVTVSTPALAERYGARGHAVVLPNCVPEALTDLCAAEKNSCVVVGWGGWTATHPGDLPVTRGGVAHAVRIAGAQFRAVGDGEGVAHDLGFEGKEVTATGQLSFDDYFQAIANLDVGIVPLARTRFNAAKSWLKGIEYAAAGVPFVASPTTEYGALAVDGVGMLAQDRGRDWARKVAYLLDPDKSRAWAEHSREVIRERHTYERNGWKWAEAWAEAMHRRARPTKKAV